MGHVLGLECQPDVEYQFSIRSIVKYQTCSKVGRKNIYLSGPFFSGKRKGKGRENPVIFFFSSLPLFFTEVKRWQNYPQNILEASEIL